ncbi:MAG: hypothetical protein ACRDWH_01335, partial [Acidimicrobiia bacterium]
MRIPLAPLGVVGALGLLLVIMGGLATLARGGDDLGSRNIAPILLWVYFWLVVPFLGAVVGNLYTGINPWRSLSRWLGLGERERSDLLVKIGLWPGTFLLLAFTWIELVYPNSADPASIAVAAIAYTVFLLGLIARFGRDNALTSFDAFTTYNRLISSLSPFGRTRQGRLIRRGWLRALPALPEHKGLAGFLVVMIGTVSFDGLSATTWWESAMGSFGSTVMGRTLLLVMMCLLIGGAYYLACSIAVRLGGGARTVAEVASRFAHTLVPIAFAYAFAHYFTLVIFEGQSIISAASDPFGLGWDLFGTRDYKVNFFLGAIPVWYVQVGAIVLGHLAGVVLAHDRALAD